MNSSFSAKPGIVLLLLAMTTAMFAQNEHIDYRSTLNPFYWKNRKPNAAYWQQDVHYNISASLDDSTDVITGEEDLIYWNNSPHSIPYLYFHLYNNAQTKDSYLADLYRNNQYNLPFSKYRAANLGTEVSMVSVQGKNLVTEKDNTILKVYLDEPLPPGASVTIHLSFKTYFDREVIRNRMKMFNSSGKKHFDIVHWYPRVTVVDSKFGWTTDQHMDHEFYGDFGSFHVEFNLPNDYVLDGTGVLINENEVMPKSLRRKLDISNYIGQQKPDSPPIVRDGSRKTWKFSAINVHDFAMTADPNYRIGETNWNDVRCIALVQEAHAPGWKNAAGFIAKVLDVNSSNIGPYPHPKMIVADAQDGMEYPMLTLCGGWDPGYRSLLIHEMTHNWFQGMVGSNETYRAWMDEGLTQFYTADTYQYIDGPVTVEEKPNGQYVERFTRTQRVVDDEIYTPYMAAVSMRKEEAVLNTHADDFNGGIRHGGGYGQSYTKTAAMLKNLEYVLGRALFDRCMQHYFDKWRFCHPYPEDFREAIIEYSSVDLNWFFDEWLETTKYIDYSVSRVKRKKGGVYEITFKRKGTMQMPLDFSVIDANDSARHYYIPNNWYVKATHANVLPRWIGWGPKLRTTYTATLNIGTSLKNVIIDPSYRLADVDMTNNSWKSRMNVVFDSKVYNPPDWKRYEMRVRPSLWYNGFDGLKVGTMVSGDYMNSKHIFSAGIWFSTGIAQAYLPEGTTRAKYNVLSFLLDYKTSIHRFIPKTNFYAQVKSLDGLDALVIGFEKKLRNDQTRIYTHYKAMLRDTPLDTLYLIDQHDWTIQKLNSAMYAGIEHMYKYKHGTGNLQFNIRASAFTNDYDYSYINFISVNKHELGKFGLNTRVFAQTGFGNRLPLESMLMVAGANNEDLMDNKYTRSMGFFPPSWGTVGPVTNHFTAGGGLGLRGYSGYLLAQKNSDGSFSYNYHNTTGASASAELEFGKLFRRFNPKMFRNSVRIQPYLFGDAGVININKPGKPTLMSDLLVDAGAGATLSIVKWGRLSGLKPLVIRFDMPFFINRLPYAEKDYFQFRWMIGINRAF